MTLGRPGHTATLLKNGSLLMVGGRTGRDASSALDAKPTANPLSATRSSAFRGFNSYRLRPFHRGNQFVKRRTRADLVVIVV
jgi:hypothetical protein